MALGPEVSEAILRKMEEDQRRQNQRINEANRERALLLVSLVAKYAEIALDKRISEGNKTPRVSERDIEQATQYWTFWGNVKCRFSAEDAVHVILRAPAELKKILEEKYLPKGWKEVRFDLGHYICLE